MNFNMLSNFIVVARTGSFTSAAQSLFISQQGLNKMVSSMESELGCKLLERTSRGVTLTDAGRVVLAYAETLVDGYEAMRGELDAFDQDRELMARAPYKMASTALCIERIIRPLVSMGILGDVTLREVTLESALDMARRDGWLALVDIPSYTSPTPKTLAGGAIFEIATVKMGVAFDAASYPSLVGNPSAADVAAHPLGIIDAPTMREYAGSVFDRDALSEQMRYLTRQYDMLTDAVLAGRAVALFDSLSWSQSETKDVQGATFSQIADHVCEIGFVYREGDRDAAKREFIHAFRRVFRSTADKMDWDIG